MNGKTHTWVALQAKNQMKEPYQSFLDDEWEWVEGAVLLPDSHLRYDTTDAGELNPEYKKRFPVHSHDFDTGVPHGYGLVGEAFRYFDGPAAFIRDCKEDDTDSYYGQIAFYMGMLCHFIGDLCTPVHVGSKFDSQLKELLGLRFHQRIESKMQRLIKNIDVSPIKTSKLPVIGRPYFEGIAKNFTFSLYGELVQLLSDQNRLDKRLKEALLKSVEVTTVAWTALLIEGEFEPKK